MRASKDGYANDAMSWGPQVAPGAKLLLNATGAVNKMATFNTSFVSFRTKMCGMIPASSAVGRMVKFGFCRFCRQKRQIDQFCHGGKTVRLVLHIDNDLRERQVCAVS